MRSLELIDHGAAETRPGTDLREPYDLNGDRRRAGERSHDRLGPINLDWEVMGGAAVVTQSLPIPIPES
jgi:hypothetical protein